MNALQTDTERRQRPTRAVHACRTCHALFEPARPRRARSTTGAPAARTAAELDDDRYCSKACRRDGHRRHAAS